MMSNEINRTGINRWAVDRTGVFQMIVVFREADLVAENRQYRVIIDREWMDSIAYS